MKELRIDKMTGDKVIFSSSRANRPKDKCKIDTKVIKEDNLEEYSETCPFCKGNEYMSNVITDEICDCNGWKVKSVLNKYPILDMETDLICGIHEVIIDNCKHNKNFYNMTFEEFEDLFKMYQSRYSDLKKIEKIKYVIIFKNFLRNSGASLMHPHSQIVAMSMLPPEVEKEKIYAINYYNDNKINVYDKIINDELSDEKRVIYNGKYFLMYVPFASRYNSEIRIISKNKDLVEDWNSNHVKELSFMFEKVFKKIYNLEGNVPFNLSIHSEPIEDDSEKYFRLHMHIIPRKYNFGGFELSTNLFVCSMDPNEYAERLKTNKNCK